MPAYPRATPQVRMSLGQSCIASVQLDADDLDAGEAQNASSHTRRRRTFSEETTDEPVSIMQSLCQSACCTLLWGTVFALMR